jgi:hypothetical protein
MAERIRIGGRQHGKSWAAATRLGLSMDEYREMMRKQHEGLARARELTPIPPPRDFFRMLWDEASRPHVGQSDFMREYLCEFTLEPERPELCGPPFPTYEQWERSQRETAEIERRGGGWRFNWSGI